MSEPNASTARRVPLITTSEPPSSSPDASKKSGKILCGICNRRVFDPDRKVVGANTYHSW